MPDEKYKRDAKEPKDLLHRLTIRIPQLINIKGYYTSLSDQLKPAHKAIKEVSSRTTPARCSLGSMDGFTKLDLKVCVELTSIDLSHSSSRTQRTKSVQIKPSSIWASMWPKELGSLNMVNRRRRARREHRSASRNPFTGRF